MLRIFANYSGGMVSDMNFYALFFASLIDIAVLRNNNNQSIALKVSQHSYGETQNNEG